MRARQQRKPGRRSGRAWGERPADPLAHLPLKRYMDAHFEWMLVTGYSADTVRARKTAIRRFIAWCDERGIAHPKDVTKPVLDRYQRSLFYYRKPMTAKDGGAPLTLGSQHGLLAPLKTYFRWLARESHILYNPASELELPKLPKHLPRAILSVAEIEAILGAADPATPEGLRDRAMMEVLYSSAIRRQEMVNLQRYDADLSRLVLFVREGKGGKDRVVPLGARAARWLDLYLTRSRPLLLAHEHETLFVNDWGDPITPEYLAGRVRLRMTEAGIDKPGTCHLFRHACATHMLENGADIRFIQAMLGHASLSTTERYTHVAIAKLQQIHADTHPAILDRGHGRGAAIEDELMAALGAEADEETAPS